MVPLYISEISTTRNRGSLGSLNQLTICVGILLALFANVAVAPTGAWRPLFGLAVAPGALLALGMAAAPESPRWLASVGAHDEALRAGRALWGAECAAELQSPPDGREGKAQAAASGGGGGGGGGGSALTRTVALGGLLFLLQQFSGINAVVYFSSKVFRDAGVASETLATLAVGALNVVGTVLAGSIIDRVRRKTLLCVSWGAMGAAMLGMAGLRTPAAAVAGTLLYIFAFACGVGPVPGLMVPEMNPSATRGQAVSVAMGSHWVCNAVIGQAFLPAVDAYGLPGVYTFFGAVCFAGVAFVRLCVPETSGKSMEEIEKGLAV